MRPLAALLVALLLAVSAAAEPVRIPGTRVRLEVPEGFALSDDFPGIGRGDDLTSILVSGLDAPLARTREDFTSEALAAQGVRVHRADPVRVGGHDGLLLHATQRAQGVDFRKWILLLGDERRSVLLTATTPLDLESVHQEALVETLRTAVWDAEEAPPEAPLPFRVPEVPPLRVVSRASQAVVLTDPDHDAARTVPPVVALGASTSHVDIGDLAAFARRRLEESVSVEEIEILRERRRDLDGLPGHEIRAKARDASTHREVILTQVLATDGRRYYLLQGVVDGEDAAELAPLVEAVIAGFERIE